MIMKARIYLVLFSLLVIAAGCKKDFLERLPQDQLVDESYWAMKQRSNLCVGFISLFSAMVQASLRRDFQDSR